jgi:hypothetical protein
MIKIFFVLMKVIDGRVDKNPSHPSFERSTLPGMDVLENLYERFMKDVFSFSAGSGVPKADSHHPAGINRIKLLLGRRFIVNTSPNNFLFCH